VRRLQAVGIALLVACSSGSYSVSVVFESEADRDRARAIELALVDGGCGETTIGAPAIDPVQQIVIRRGATAMLAPVPTGRYGLYGIARDAQCAAIASGCADVDLEAGASGVAMVTLRSIGGPRCAASRCVDGSCVTGVEDGGPGMDSAIPLDGSLDGAPRDAPSADAPSEDARTIDAPTRDARSDDDAGPTPIDAERDAPVDAPTRGPTMSRRRSSATGWSSTILPSSAPGPPP
jgi:hypothetical protein